MASVSDRLVSIKLLRKCVLWEGSILQSHFLNGDGLHESQVQDRIMRLERCDDRTPLEEEYLTALRETLKSTPVLAAPQLPPAKGPKS